MASLEQLAQELVLGSVLEQLVTEHGGYELVDHWTQGEFHHNVVVRVASRGDLGGDVLVVATNCNGGVKEVLAFDRIPDRWALWHDRCPANPEFNGELPPLRGTATTEHWFIRAPCSWRMPGASSARVQGASTRRRLVQALTGLVRARRGRTWDAGEPRGLDPMTPDCAIGANRVHSPRHEHEAEADRGGNSDAARAGSDTRSPRQR